MGMLGYCVHRAANGALGWREERLVFRYRK